ncbi:hypothetical protein STEG23_011069 [Scotinomys teguina]
MRGSMEAKANDSYSPCQHFNVTVALLVDAMKEFNAACNPDTHPGKSTTTEEEPTRKDSLNHTCGIMGNTSNCIHISMSLEMDVKSVTCSVKITWYILVLLVLTVGIILIIHKILEDHRRAQRWKSHKSKSTSFLLRGSDSEKLSELNARVIPESTRGLPSVQVVEVLPPIPELEVTSAVHQQDQYTRSCREKSSVIQTKVNPKALKSQDKGDWSPNQRQFTESSAQCTGKIIVKMENGEG